MEIIMFLLEKVATPLLVVVLWFFVNRKLKHIESLEQEKQRVFVLEKLVSEKFLDVLQRSHGWFVKLHRELVDLKTREFSQPDCFVDTLTEASSFFDRSATYLPEKIRDEADSAMSMMQMVRNNLSKTERLAEIVQSCDDVVRHLNEMHKGITHKYNRFLIDQIS